jgi:hypothetical protein
MGSRNPPEQLPDKDRLITRPDDHPLPTPLDPAGPESRGGDVDPKPGPEASPGNPAGSDPDHGDLGRSV